MINGAWPLRPLGELFEIGAGKTMSVAARTGDDKTPFLRTSNVLWDEIDLTAVDEMAIPAHERQEKLLAPGDLLVCEGGEIGRAAIWNGEVKTMSFQNHLHRLRSIADNVEPRFYVYFLQSGFTQLGIFEGAGNKTTIPNLSRNRLAALDVPHPAIDEQQDIVCALARVREAIKIHDRCLASAQDLKRARMRTLFTRGLRDEPQKETEIGPVPKSWDVAAIGDVARNTQYGLSVRGQESGAYPILRMNCQEDGAVHYRNLQFVDLDSETYEVFRLKPGDLLFNRTNSIELVGRMAIVEDDRPAVFASYLVRLTVDQERCLPPFLNYFMNWPATQDEIKKLASRAVGQANINASKLRTVLFPLPPTVDEQREIIAVLDAIDSKIGLHKRKRAVLDELFKSLLHKLMTGEIRVGDLDLSVLDFSKVAEVAA
ncbi:restriction endonuclease subunit S [Acidiphilium sp. AL]|uniref:restriction endonuclease subunit S n=1 Tax=Acidiphilium sp. AL TaxID=2871704 RepID=UPI0021CB3133|nr:restriction endonuclease subunit S [Acidiphilium sp. AL]MCU4161641.1 restriction endonuclease subunit S [Acidiphilium sp. AL]